MLTAVFERAGVDIAWAKVTTLGSSVVDAFCFVVPARTTGDSSQSRPSREALERDLYAMLPAPPPPKPGAAG